jgi:hypothetical protein
MAPLAAQDNVAIVMKVHHAASVRCVFAYVQQPTTDGQSAYSDRREYLRNEHLWSDCVKSIRFSTYVEVRR